MGERVGARRPETRGPVWFTFGLRTQSKCFVWWTDPHGLLEEEEVPSSRAARSGPGYAKGATAWAPPAWSRLKAPDPIGSEPWSGKETVRCRRWGPPISMN